MTYRQEPPARFRNAGDHHPCSVGTPGEDVATSGPGGAAVSASRPPGNRDLVV